MIQRNRISTEFSTMLLSNLADWAIQQPLLVTWYSSGDGPSARLSQQHWVESNTDLHYVYISIRNKLLSGKREGGEPVDKGLKPPFRPLVIDLSSIVCKMLLSSVGRCKIWVIEHVFPSKSLCTVESTFSELSNSVLNLEIGWE